MSSKILIPCAAATMTCFGAVALSPIPATAYDGRGYCYYHPHDPVCLAGVVAPYLHHHGEYYDHHDHYHDHDHDHHHDHDHDHDHDHHHHHDHDHHRDHDADQNHRHDPHDEQRRRH